VEVDFESFTSAGLLVLLMELESKRVSFALTVQFLVASYHCNG